MSLVSDVTNPVLFDLLEDPPVGPVLGVITQQQIIDLVNLTASDWAQRTCTAAQVTTQYVQAATARYSFPDPVMRIDNAFLGGVLLEPTTVQALNDGSRGWRTEQGLPTRWHADELPLKTIELAAIPNDTGVFVSGTNYPDPPYAQDGWMVSANGSNLTPDLHRDLTLIGPQMPATVASTSDPLVYGSTGNVNAPVPQDFVLGYLGFGVLARIFSGDNELHDDARAAWCASEYESGIQLVKAIMDESSGG